jgi:uncharacterized membrane protein (DUF4010 family)
VDGDPAVVLRVAVAAICGAAVGVERQWSGHATGPLARFGGVRTFTLLGALAGLAGWMWTLGAGALAAVVLGGAVALVIAAYLAVSGRDADATTEVAGMVTICAGALAGLGFLALASGVTAVTALLLLEKSRLHSAVAHVDDAEMRAGARFAVMAVVILPLLPEGPYGPWGIIKPRELWLLVLFFSGLSFVGFIARRAVGARHGFPLTGLIGGLVSSTNVTLTFARASASRPALGKPLAFGIVAACSMLFLRVLVATAVLNQALMTTLLPYVAVPFLIGAATTIAGWRQLDGGSDKVEEPRNPLELRAALQMAVLFQVVLIAVQAAKGLWGDRGLFVSGALLGLTDMDALTISMAKTASEPAAYHTAAQAIAIGILSNTLVKMGVASWLGRGAVRTVVPAVLAAMAVAGAISIYVLL